MKLSKGQIYLAGLLMHLLAAFFSVGYHQCDELFQVFEFAGYKLGLNNASEMPWEFTACMRSGIEPLLVYLATRLCNAVSVNDPFQIALLLRLIMALISFTAVVRFLKFVEGELSDRRQVLNLWLFGLLFWCLPYFHARLSSENFSATLFLLGLTTVLREINTPRRMLPWLTSGILFGLSFVCRFQTLFMLAGLFAWLLLIRKASWRVLVALVAGFILALGVGLLIDKWLYGQWVLSWWNYFYQNLLQNKASVYGESPVYFYLEEALLQLIPPFSLVIVAGIIAFWVKFRRHYLTWITLPFIAAHFFVAHKELRFLFPVLNYVPFMILLLVQEWGNSQNKLPGILKSKGFLYSAVIVNAILLCFFSFKPADETSKSLESIYTLVKGEAPLLLYEGHNPYNNNASLNYFRNNKIKTADIGTDSLVGEVTEPAYLYIEKFGLGDTLQKSGMTFTRIHSNFPAWFQYLNFNGWLQRANSYSIYRLTKR